MLKRKANASIFFYRIPVSGKKHVGHCRAMANARYRRLPTGSVPPIRGSECIRSTYIYTLHPLVTTLTWQWKLPLSQFFVKKNVTISSVNEALQTARFVTHIYTQGVSQEFSGLHRHFSTENTKQEKLLKSNEAVRCVSLKIGYPLVN